MDSPEAIEKRFIFFGNAVAFAAHIRRPGDYQFKAVASSCLPVTGGLAVSTSGPQSFENIITFKSASTSALGDFADTRRAIDFTQGNFAENELSTQTFVDSRLSGLKISVTQDDPQQAAGKAAVFAVDELHARLESFSDRRSPTAFRGLEANFQGVTVDGHELLVITAPEICTQYETYDKLVHAYQEDGDFRKRFGSLFSPTGHEKTGVGALLSRHTIPNEGGLILGTIVTALRWASTPAPGTEIMGNRLKVDGIGSIYFGEILFEHNARRLTLLRFQLGSPTGADGSAVEVHSNGQTWPPKATGS
jgi:hypothetical protein